MFRRIWRIRVYESIFKFFSDLIPTWWIIKIVLYKNFCHIIIHKIVASLKVLNSSFFSFFLFVTNTIDRVTCENVIEKANAKVIVCLNQKFFCRYKKLCWRLQTLISWLKEDRIDSLLNEKQEKKDSCDLLLWRRFSCSSNPRLERWIETGRKWRK